MDTALFNELLESVKEAGQIKRDEKPAARIFNYSHLDIQSIREKTGYSQSHFSKLIGISLRTYQNWEQGHRHPTGAARVLLTLLDQAPEYVINLLEKSEHI